MTITYAMTASILFIGLAIIFGDAGHKLKHSEHRRISLVLIGTAMLYVALDCLWIFEYTGTVFHRGLFILLNLLFYLVYITLPYIWFLFAGHFAGVRIRERRWNILFAAPWMFNLALVLLTMAGTDLLWSIGDAAERYARGPLFGVFSRLNLVYYFFPVISILFMLLTRKNADRKTLLITLGFSLIPAMGVFIYTFWIPEEAIYPFQPCCFFLGVMFAYILLISEVYKNAEEENIRLQEESRSVERMADLMASVAALLTNMPAMTFSKDAETGVYLACNQSFAEFADRKTPEDLVGLRDDELFDPETAAAIIKGDRITLEREEPYVFFEDTLDASGDIRHLQTTKLTFQDATGRQCLLGMCVDVTEMTRFKAAEARTSAKNDFLANMSHDIRTPMNAIVGYTNIARERIRDPEAVEEALEKIGSSSHFLLSLINDILDISKIESGKLQITPGPCNLEEVFRRIEDITSLQARSKSLDIRYQRDNVRHYRVMADELRLEQILINIISNAIKYTPEGNEVDLTAEELGPGEAGKIRYRFTIRDTGVGISEEYLPYIFDSFTREQRTTINRVQGTGLGLAITARIVELMGGTISVQSKLGEGSEFKVELELETLEDTEETETVEKEPAAELGGKRILVAEDNDINAEIALMILEQYGIRAERAENGRICVEKITENGKERYDGVLMDIQMPEMDGYEATRAIRAIDPKIPIIAMSANAYEEDVQACLDAGMNAHLAKPFQPEQLRRLLQQYL